MPHFKGVNYSRHPGPVIPGSCGGLDLDGVAGFLYLHCIFHGDQEGVGPLLVDSNARNFYLSELIKV